MMRIWRWRLLLLPVLLFLIYAYGWESDAGGLSPVGPDVSGVPRGV
ncbi:MAG: hypothetical protein H6Q83_2244 [Deltaproteobacteria bacterium]|nr:hypothetical protein [Deltaproteobacteria bacterium]